MYIIFEYEVITDGLLCVVDKVLGVFTDYQTAKDFFINERDKRNLDPNKLLDKKVGDRGITFFGQGHTSHLLTDLKLIEAIYLKQMEEYNAQP